MTNERPTLVVAGVLHQIVDETLLTLTTKVTSGSRLGQWELPGGKVEYNESFAEAISRELNEELGFNFLDRWAMLPVIQEKNIFSSGHYVVVPMVFLGILSTRNVEHIEYAMKQQGVLWRWVDQVDREVQYAQGTLAIIAEAWKARNDAGLSFNR